MKRLFYSRLFVGFFVFLLVFCQPFFVYAAISTNSNAFAVNPDYLIGTGSDAEYGLMTMELTDEDYGVSTYSSLASVTNTVDYSHCSLFCRFVDSKNAVSYLYYPLDSNGHATYKVPSGKKLTHCGLQIRRSGLPAQGTYAMQLDFSSDFSNDYSSVNVASYKYLENASDLIDWDFLTFDSFSGDLYATSVVRLASLSLVEFHFALDNPLPSGTSFGGYFSVNFTKSSATADKVFGDDVSSDIDYQNDVSGSLSDISSSIGNMSSSLDSAAENLEYISTSQNLIIQGIDNVIMHISDQLYAFWDQLYNLIHEPTYARLEQILLALKAIANNSDISAVVDTIEETTQQQITNDNSNTAKVESAVEKHGNFIIEGLKGLFIPSDEYFKSYFDDLYTYFSDRFGFLSFPIDLLVRLVDLFVNSSDVDCILTLPEFEISGEQLITQASFNLTEFLENDFAILLSSIRLVTSIGLIMAFVNLCQDKWNEVMRN